ncbi:tetratricopeptide repeat protein [Aureivirga sp. CE67]|uniref:tetratricopeptide repeat protein n=1 Tax=Aureivirga sp. CE67 TaxID=1788983 RepID=UPI0018CB1418|nr:tetratricopeptide repeat protein [Aureivirga sp. CE67]
MELNNIEKANLLFLEADSLIKDYEIEQAIICLNKALELNPNLGNAHNHLGWLYETKFKDYENAEKHYNKALELSPNYTATYLNKAILLSTLNRFDELEPFIFHALTIPGTNKAKLNNELGIMHELKQDYKQAIFYFKESCKYTLDNDDFHRYERSIERCKKKMNLAEDSEE